MDKDVIDAEVLQTGALPVPAFQRPIATSAMVPSGAHSMSQLDTGIFKAVQELGPRDLAQFERNVLYEASRAGDAYYYEWTAGGKTIRGASIGLAMTMFRHFGKATVITTITGEDSLGFTLSSTWVDYETGGTFNRMFRQRKDINIGRGFDRDADQQARKLDIAFQIGQSKAIRNVILAAMPPYVVAAAMGACRSRILGEIKEKGVGATVKECLAKLDRYKVTEDRVVARFGKQTPEFVDRDALDLLNTVRAIEDKEIHPNAAFPIAEGNGAAKSEPPATSPAAALFGDAPKPEPAPDPEPPAAPEGPKSHPFAWPADADTPQKRMAALSNEFGPGASNAIKEASDKAPMPWPKQNPAERMTTLEDARKILTGETS